MAKNDLAQAYLATYLWKQWRERSKVKTHYTGRAGRELAQCQSPGWKGGRV